MDRKTENQLRQEIAEVWALLDAERAGRAALIRRIEQEEQSVAVVREPIYWIDPDDDANLSRIGRVGWSPLYGESPASIQAAELATLREKAARFETVALSRCADRIKLLWIEQEWDDLRKDAERYRWIRDKSHSLETRQYDKGIVNGPSCYHEVEGIRELKYEGALDAAIDAALAQEGE